MIRRRLLLVAGPYAFLRLFGQAAEFAAWVVLARRLGADELGQLTVAFLACRYGGLVADWGASVRGVREVAALADPHAVHALVDRRRRVTLLLGATYIAVTLVTGHAELVPVVGTLAGRGLSRDWIALGRSRGVRAGAPWALQGAVLLVFSLLVVDDIGDAAAVLGLAYLATTGVSIAVNALPAVVRGNRSTVTPRPDAWGVLYLMAEQVCFTADAILLAILSSAHDAGIYALVYRVPNAWTTILMTTIAGALPAVTGAVVDDRQMIGRLRRRALRLGGVFGAGVLLAIVPAVLLVGPVFGAEYRSGRTALALLMVATAVKSVAAPLQPLCLATQPDRRMGSLMAAVAGVNVAANLVLIPTIGMIGAAIATIVSESVLAARLVWLSRSPAVTTASDDDDVVAAVASNRDAGPPKVDVVILTWNDGELLDHAVESALASTGVDVRVLVIDNASEPPAAVSPDPRVQLHRNEVNRGVAGARNQGVCLGAAPFVCLLDSDARLEPDCLARLVAALDDPVVAFAGPVFAGQRPEESGGSAPTATRKVARLLGRTSSYASDRAVDAAVWDVDFAIGACQLFRRSVYDAVGGIDERYFYGPEDVDFCLRIKAAGHRLVQVAAACCHHPPRRRHRRLLTRGGLYHARATCRHLWRHRGGVPRATA